jgi:hypothetical protein
MTIRDFGALMRQWSELEAAGIPLEPLENRVGIDTRASGAGLTIRVGRDRSHGEIRELKNGSFAYILPVFVRRNLPGKTIIRDSWIEPPWPEPVTRPTKIDAKSKSRSAFWISGISSIPQSCRCR